MPSALHPEDIRETVLRVLGELLGRPVARDEIVETVLLRRGYYYGRAYRHGGLAATLTAETLTLCICTDDGRLLRTIELAGEAAGARLATVARSAEPSSIVARAA
jgi:hypothetical protein